MMAGAEQSVAFGQFPARVGSYEVWSDKVALDLVNAIVAADHLQMGESSLAPDGAHNLSTFDIEPLACSQRGRSSLPLARPVCRVRSP
jgi:hypothetical protein